MDFSIIQPLLDWIARHEALAVLVIFLVAAAESLAIVGIVVPGVAFMLGIGALVGLQSLPLMSTLIWAMAGAVAGDSVSYWLGKHFDKQLQALWPLSRYPQLIPRGERFFRRHGGKSIMLGRFVGPLRPIVPFIAGMMHMPPARFLVFNVVSAILWAPVVILPGVVFGKSLQMASEVLLRLGATIAALIILFGVIGWFIRKMYLVFAAETIDTWTAFLIKHMGRTGLASVMMVLVLSVAMSTHLSRTANYQQPAVLVQPVQAEQWWNADWQNMPFFHNGRIHGQPITIQYWGKLTELHQRLLSIGWKDATPLTMKNVLYFFTPSIDLMALPVRTYPFYKQKESLLMLSEAQLPEQQQVIRFWRAQPHRALNENQLWLGTVDTMSLFHLGGLLNVPVYHRLFRQSLLTFKDEFMATQPPVGMKYALYETAPIFDAWRGEVVLLALDVDLSKRR